MDNTDVADIHINDDYEIYDDVYREPTKTINREHYAPEYLELLDILEDYSKGIIGHQERRNKATELRYELGMDNLRLIWSHHCA